MSGGSQHNPNGRQSQLGSGWSPLQLQVANLLARAPQAHMASDRGVTWHTPTPPPHLYHVPAPSPPDPLQGLLQLQALKTGSNSVFRHTATPPELYRHTPTPPDKHHMRHTPSPGDMKTPTLPPVDLYQHLAPSRDKLRTDDLLAYARVGVDLSIGGPRASNGAATSPAPPPATPPGAAPSLSVRDAPTINSLIARAAPRHAHARVDALLERLVPAPASPHSVIVHPRAAPTPSPPDSNEDSADSCGAPPGSKRKRKPERTVRVPAPPPPAPAPAPTPPAPVASEPARSPAPPPAAPAPPSAVAPRVSPPPPEVGDTKPPPPLENGDASHAKTNGPEERPQSPRPDQPHARRKTRSGSAETIADIAAMIADTDHAPAVPLLPAPEPPVALSVDKLRSVLASPDEPRAEPRAETRVEPRVEPPGTGEPAPVVAPVAPAPAAVTPPVAAPPTPPAPPPAPAAAPRRRSARTSNPEAPNVPVESPSEAKPAEPEAGEASTAEPAAASFVEVENQLEKMFAGIEEEPPAEPAPPADAAQSGDSAAAGAGAAGRKRRRSAPARPERRAPRGLASIDTPRKKQQKKKQDARRPRKGPREISVKDAYDSGSNASSGKSRGPYIQIRGPRDSPLSVSVMNNSTGEEEDSGSRRKHGEEFRNGVRGVRGVRGLHASTLGLRYDATTPDATWLCAFCQRGPHAASLGDLFGPYQLDTDCEEFRALDEATRRRYCSDVTGAADEVWFHEACGVWAPGLVAAGARLWGLAAAVWGARAARCADCGAAGAALACGARACRARAHLPCARAWSLRDDFRALCPAHAV
ncbi:uncharacterized protein LOC142974632 isoform X2 [Anticarsia gemmatalis]|uniref:uncharacterized protein LOC142974632 isoform X2 n=1 Tax=Anticarsia gemmatalis TaxID=129554 RepID=UPI003F76F858